MDRHTTGQVANFDYEEFITLDETWVKHSDAMAEIAELKEEIELDEDAIEEIKAEAKISERIKDKQIAELKEKNREIRGLRRCPEDIKRIAELEAWKLQWSDSLELAHNKISADAIREMLSKVEIHDELFRWIEADDIEQYADNLEKSDGYNESS